MRSARVVGNVEGSGEHHQHGRDRTEKRRVLAICCLALLIATMDNTVVNVALPTIQRSLGASGTGLQWVVDAYVLVLASLMLTSGALGDRYGRRRMFQIGLVIFGAGSLACSLAPSLGVLVAARAFQGIGGSMLTPSTLSIVSNVYVEPAERARAIGIWGATSGLSIGLGPILGGALVVAVGWPSVFWINLPICAVAIVAAHRYVPESRSDSPRRLDWPGQLCATAALALTAYALIGAPSTGWASGTTIALFAAAALMAVAFLLVEHVRREPLIELRFFRNPPFSASVLVAFTAFVALFAFVFFNTLYLQEVRAESALLAGIMTLPATGLIVFAAPLSGRMVAVRGPRLPTTLSCVLMGAGLLLLTLVGPATPLWQQVLSYTVLGVGIGLVNPPITNGAVSGMPRQQAGVASATASTARQVGGVFGVALIGSIVFSAFRSEFRPGAARGGTNGLSLSLTSLPPQLRAAADGAFASAVHRGYLVAGLLMIVVAPVAGATMGRTRPSAQAGARPGSPAGRSAEDAVPAVSSSPRSRTSSSESVR
jgi:EmrB/QacA subfamily drug resistance transporter